MWLALAAGSTPGGGFMVAGPGVWVMIMGGLRLCRVGRWGRNGVEGDEDWGEIVTVAELDGDEREAMAC